MRHKNNMSRVREGTAELVLWQTVCAHYIEKFAVIWRMFLAKRFLSGKLEKYHEH